MSEKEYNGYVKKLFQYETHLHTKQASACASSNGADYILPYIQAGYSGLIVTDHFWGGNSCIPRTLSWAEWVDSFCKGYESALAEADRINMENRTKGTEQEFRVFFGFEQTFSGDDYLIYGLDKEWLLQHPEVISMTHSQLFNAVEQDNGLMIQAHPFRLRSYMNAIHLHPREVHGVEILNAGNKPYENEQAELYAKFYDFPVTAGSDIHDISKIQFTLSPLSVTGMAFPTPLSSIYDYCELVKNRKGTIIK